MVRNEVKGVTDRTVLETRSPSVVRLYIDLHVSRFWGIQTIRPFYSKLVCIQVYMYVYLDRQYTVSKYSKID